MIYYWFSFSDMSVVNFNSNCEKFISGMTFLVNGPTESAHGSYDKNIIAPITGMAIRNLCFLIKHDEEHTFAIAKPVVFLGMRKLLAK